MTLIVKELVIRGIVSTDHSQINDPSFDKENLLQYLEQMKKEIERECLEKLEQKIETRSTR